MSNSQPHVTVNNYVSSNNSASSQSASYFDGSLIQLIGWYIVGFLITSLTLGICYPWAVCKIYAWEVKHTVINGRRLDFDGKAIQLFGTWIKWFLLSIITLGIYLFFVSINLKKWKTKHTFFA